MFLLHKPRFQARNAIYRIIARHSGVLPPNDKVNDRRYLQAKIEKRPYIVGSTIFPSRIPVMLVPTSA